MVSCVTGCGTNSCLSQCLHLATHIRLGHDRQGRQQRVRAVQAMAGQQEAGSSGELRVRQPLTCQRGPLTCPHSACLISYPPWKDKEIPFE